MDLALPKGYAAMIERTRKVVDWLEGRYEQWGRPRFDIRSEIFWEMVFDIIKVWEKTWPNELKDWMHNRKVDLAIEKPLRELSKQGLKKSVGYPPHLYTLMKQYWPGGSFASKEFTQAFMGRYPMFRNSNYT